METVKKLGAIFAIAATALVAQVVPSQASVGGNASNNSAVVQLWSTDYKATNRLCSGTHIGKGWIVTAKHCVDSVGVQAGYGNVVWGTTNIDWNNRQTHDQNHGKITRVVKNADSNKDIALLKSDALAQDSSAATMPLANIGRVEELANQSCTAYGYGIWTEEDASAAALPWNQRSVDMTITRATTSIERSSKSQLEGENSNGAYLNTGDSGGALVCGGQLSGVTVALTNRYTNTFMGISTPERNWIRLTTGL